MTFDALISSLYAAASGRSDWTTTLTHVAEFLDLWTVQVLGIDKKNGHLMFSVHGGKSTPQTGLDYFRCYHAIDPRVGLAARTPLGQWFHCHEHFDDSFVARDPFYQEFLIPHGGRYASATNLIDNDEVVFMLALMRGHGSPPLTRQEQSVADQLRHHFSAAMKNLVHSRETFAELGMARELLGQLNYPMLLVDETRGIWHSNARGTAMLQAGVVVGNRAGLLACHDKAGDAALTEAIYELQALNDTPQTTPSRRAVRLRGSNGGSYLALISAIQSERTMAAFGRGARALVILHDPQETRPGRDLLVLTECFDFTPAEARIAIAITEGANLKQIAQRTGTELSTVRTHLQHVLRKAAVERQADLVRALMALPVRI
ncbi:helix-turn-helix transcriptional regulator [Variovorax sp. GB1P17]|uniref:helix-turn-helix transcriptional regulator n=1 Tax=Variovorax sp. GB1P17 TaxID=3443740 RepID=UPI003F4633DF